MDLEPEEDCCPAGDDALVSYSSGHGYPGDEADAENSSDELDRQTLTTTWVIGLPRSRRSAGMNTILPSLRSAADLAREDAINTVAVGGAIAQLLSEVVGTKINQHILLS